MRINNGRKGLYCLGKEFPGNFISVGVGKVEEMMVGYKPCFFGGDRYKKTEIGREVERE